MHEYGESHGIDVASSFRAAGGEELLEDLMEQLEICTNKEFFQIKKEHQLDSEEEESETPAEM